MRHQGDVNQMRHDILNQNKEMSTTMVPPNLSSTAIGTTLCRTHLMEGKKMSLLRRRGEHCALVLGIEQIIIIDEKIVICSIHWSNLDLESFLMSRQSRSRMF
jgi:hypothetical protein